MKVPEYITSNECSLVRCAVTFSKDYLVKAADEVFFNFIGKQIRIHLQECIHPDFWEEFDSNCRTIAVGDSCDFILPIKGEHVGYQLCSVHLINEGKTMQGDDLLFLQICNLSSYEERMNEFMDAIGKYQTFLSIVPNLYFEYDTMQDEILIYRYQGGRTNIIYSAKLDEYKAFVIDKLDKTSDINEFDNWYHHLREAKCNFSCKVRIPVPTAPEELAYYQMEGRMIYRKDKKTSIAGMLVELEKRENENIPYYETAEGKDAATGVLNKRASQEYANDILAEDENAVHYLVIIDIDNFKDVNDTFGHMFGDEVINMVVESANLVLDGRGFVGRFGGDEFFMLTNSIQTKDEFRAMITAFRQRVLHAFDDRMDHFQVTLSIGACCFPDFGSNYEELFELADKCLYIAKNKGKDRYVIFTPEKHRDIMKEYKKVETFQSPVQRALAHAELIPVLYSRLFQEKEKAVQSVLNEVILNYRLGGIRIYSAKNGELLFHAGEYKNLPEIQDMIQSGAIAELLGKKKLYATSSIDFMTSLNRELSERFKKSNIMSMLLYCFPKENGENVFYFYDVFASSERWLDSDKNELLSLSKTISMILPS